jgi:hypothetical protein
MNTPLIKKSALSCSAKSSGKKLPLIRPGMKKIAQNTSTSFNETVPSTDTGMPLVQDQGQPAPMKNANVNPASDPYAVVPQEYDDQAAVPEDMGFQAPPEMIGAAQSFLGPEIMQSAMAGDPTAMDLVARTAAHVGSNFMNMSAGAAGAVPTGMEGQPGAEGMQPGVEGQPEIPAGMTSPEEDLAAELVPNIAPAPMPGQMGQGAGQSAGQEAAPGQEQSGVPGQEQAQGQPQGGQEMVDLPTVARLVQLAKAGQI